MSTLCDQITCPGIYDRVNGSDIETVGSRDSNVSTRTLKLLKKNIRPPMIRVGGGGGGVLNSTFLNTKIEFQ